MQCESVETIVSYGVKGLVLSANFTPSQLPVTYNLFIFSKPVSLFEENDYHERFYLLDLLLATNIVK